MTWTTKRTAAAVLALLALHFALAVASAARKGPTFDEVYHLTAGYTYWQTGDFRMSSAKPPLPSLWAAMPWLAEPARLPRFDTVSWRESRLFEYGPQFFYGVGNDVMAMLQRSRMLVAAMSVLLGLAVFAWARALFGVGGGLLSLAVYAFSPTVLAHARLVTTDLVVSAFFLFSAATVWAVLQRVTGLRMLASGLALAGLFLAKLTAVFILPVVVAMALLRLFVRRPLPVELWVKREVTSWVGRAGVIALALLVQGILVWGGIWAAYGFRYETFRHAVTGTERFVDPYAPDSTEDRWEAHAAHSPGLARVAGFLREHRLLPEIYLYSVVLGARTTSKRSAFLDGEYSDEGFASFFPLAFLYKTPTALLALLACALAASVWRPRGWREGLYRTAPLWLLLLVYWSFAVQSRINIGHRHILPVYPLLFVLVGAASGLCAHRQRIVRWAAPALALLLALGSLRAFPHYLAYFNLIAGGPSNGYRHLVDSSLDWGQDLPALAAWLEENEHSEPVYLAYFGNAPPSHFGVRALALPYDTVESAGVGARAFGLPKLTPGTYCISATHLQQVYDPGIPNLKPSEEQQFYRGFLPLARQVEDIPLGDQRALREAVAARGPAFERGFNHFQRTRYAVLCRYLRAREPDHVIGHTIFVYELDAAELERALR